MDLNDIFANTADQDKGRDLEIIWPYTGEPTGMVFTIVGPDSVTSHRAKMQMADDRVDAADANGMISGENADKCRRACLAAHVIRWRGVTEGGEEVALNQKSLLALLKVPWIEQQVDLFAGDRLNFRPVA